MASVPLEHFVAESSARLSQGRDRKTYRIQRIGVLGAGTMGARIAGHFANSGHPVLLLDLASPGKNRSTIAAQAIDLLKNSRPAALADPSLTA